MEPADISGLVGRSYVTRSGLHCIVRKIGPGAVRVVWQGPRRPVSQADYDEVHAWAVSVLESVAGLKIDLTVCKDDREESARYAEWKKKLAE